MKSDVFQLAVQPWFPVFHARSSSAEEMQWLFGFVLAICAVILAIVVGMVAVALWRFRAREGQNEPKPRFGNVRAEIIWIVLPFLAVTGIAGASIVTMRRIEADSPRAPDLIVRGYQWWWEVEYPGQGVITANEIHLPAGERWLVQLEAGDVIHDFWVPELARKMDAVPGLRRQLWLEADQPGEYQGQCAEFCGAQHAWMRFKVIAQTRAEYQQWLAQQQRPLATTSEGRALFNQLTCASCHALEQTPEAMRVGPNLTHLAYRNELAGGVLTNTSEHLVEWLKDPQKYKPGTRMPNLKLTDEQAHTLAAMLEARP